MADQESVRAVRVQRFASFFKHYMGVSTIVTAALPVPIAELKFIPIYESQKHFFAVYTSLFAFLVFAFCFYVRHTIGQIMFGEEPKSHGLARPYPHVRRFVLNALPLLLIIGSVCCVFEYHHRLNASVRSQSTYYVDPLKDAPFYAAGSSEKPPLSGTTLMLYYIGIFLLAELAFVLMAIKEYLLDLLKISDETLIGGTSMPKKACSR